MNPGANSDIFFFRVSVVVIEEMYIFRFTTGI